MTNIEKIILITIALNIEFNLCLNQSGCLVTFKPNLIVTSQGDNPEDISPGNYVDDYQEIIYSCEKGHLLKGNSEATNYCLNGQWSKPIPECQKYCRNSVFLSATIQSTCVLNGTGVSCRHPILPGTRATITCQIGYHKTDIGARDNLYCGDDGEWDYPPYHCQQVCGEEDPDFTIFAMDGNKTTNKKVPWHVGIYSNQIREPNQQICGGTIVSARIVISAAHCFWNISNSQVNDKSLYKVGAGKYYRNYNATEPLEVQFSDIAEIHIPEGYKDIEFSYLNDIAVVVLKTYLQFTFYIKPACIKWEQYNKKAMKSNVIGRVAGWGSDTSLANYKLNTLELTTISYLDCLNKTKKEYKTLITSDKFCVAIKDDRTVCHGGGGGGFLIPVGDPNGVKRFVLQGILSNGINVNDECTGDFLTLFTNIQYFEQMINFYMQQYRVL